MVPEKLCELHVHIEGCIWDEHIQRWWNKSEYLFPPISHYKKHNKNHFTQFLEQLRFGYNFLNNLEAYAEIFKLYIEKAINQNILYSEVQINYALINTWNIDIVKLLQTINNNNNTSHKIRFIIDLPWQFSPNLLNPIIENHKSLKTLGVVGIGFGGDEALAEAWKFTEIRERIVDSGFKILCHAGETTNYNFAKELIDIIKPDRIAHGLSLIPEIVKNPSLYPSVDICISSNLKMGLVSKLSNHPVNQLIKSGARFTLSTDDPAIFNTTLIEEYNLAKKIKGFDNYIEDVNKQWIDATFDKSTVANILYK